jgi:hypothetical protein
LGFGQPRRKVVDRLSRPFVRSGLDLHHQNITRPLVFRRFSYIPFARFTGLDFVDEGAQVEPRQSCSSLLHKFSVGPHIGKGAHILELLRNAVTYVASFMK